jgi:hypothetical protein
MRPHRLAAAQLADHLTLESAEARRLVSALRRMILGAAPGAAEDVRFNCLCYYDPRAPFGAIGGNICMIEVRDGKVALSFLHGVELPDPHRLLKGTGKSKRRVLIDPEKVRDPRVRTLVQDAAASARRRAELLRGRAPT